MAGRTGPFFLGVSRLRLSTGRPERVLSQTARWVSCHTTAALGSRLPGRFAQAVMKTATFLKLSCSWFALRPMSVMPCARPQVLPIS